MDYRSRYTFQRSTNRQTQKSKTENVALGVDNDLRICRLLTEGQTSVLEGSLLEHGGTENTTAYLAQKRLLCYTKYRII